LGAGLGAVVRGAEPPLPGETGTELGALPGREGAPVRQAAATATAENRISAASPQARRSERKACACRC